MMLGCKFLLANLIVSSNIVSDTLTHLQWENNETSAISKTWEEAITHCENFNLNANTDWRLPNIRELKSIVDRTRIAPAIDNTKFITVNTNISYWSSSTYLGANDPSYAWITNFGSGTSNKTPKSSNAIVRCVRDSE